MRRFLSIVAVVFVGMSLAACSSCCDPCKPKCDPCVKKPACTRAALREAGVHPVREAGLQPLRPIGDS